MRVLLFVVWTVAAGASGCAFSPDLGDGTLACASDGACPSGYVCASDQRCYRSADGGPRAATDAAAPPDLTPPPNGGCGHPGKGNGNGNCQGN